MVDKYDNYDLKKVTSLENVPGTIKDGDGYIWDPSGLPDKDFDDSKVPLEFRRLAIWMRSKLFGKDVRETIARLAEVYGLNSKELMESFESLEGRQDNVETSTGKALNVANSAYAKATNALNLSTSADALSKSVQEQFNQVVIDGDSSVEAAQARVDERGVVHDTLKDRLDDMLSIPVFRTPPEELTLGAEIANTTWVKRTGWTGDFADGFTHEAGFTETLVLNSGAFTKDKLYLVDIQISKPDMSDRSGISDYYIEIGGSPYFETYRGTVSRQVWGIKNAGVHVALAITPEVDFVGTLKISVKEIIGFRDPQATFESAKNVSVIEIRTGGTGNNSIYVGNNSGRYSLDYPGEENTSVGNDALKTNTGGFWNSALGAKALEQNTVGSRNIAIGRVALMENETGDRNIAVGTFSLHRNKTGRNNIAIGADSLWYNTAGSGNVAIGLLASGGSAKNTNGNDNVAIGKQAMLSGTSGDRNVGIGLSALANLSTGSNNVGIGTRALLRAGEGYGNVGIGYEAGRNKWGGNSNTIIGSSAMSEATGGSRNVAIGNEALQHAESHDNTAIGFQAMNKMKGGRGNVALGVGAMYGQDDGIIGDQNIAIGEGTYRRSKGNRNIVIGVNSLNALEEGNQNIVIGNGAGTEATSGGSNILIGYNVQKSSPNAANEINIGNTIRADVVSSNVTLRRLILTGLGKTQPTTPGMLWNDNGTVKIV